MNILYLFATLPVGGAEEHLKTVLRNIDLSAFNPTVCCIGEKGAVGEEIEAMGFEVISLGRMKKKSFDTSIPGLIKDIIKTRSIDLVHAHLYHACMYGRVAAFMAAVPVVTTEHNVYLRYKLKRSLLNRLLAKKTSRIVAVSKAVRDYVSKRDSIDPSKFEVIYNGIETERFDIEMDRLEARRAIGIDEDGPVVGCVCRLSEQKGVTHLIGAFKSVLKEVPLATLLLVGDGPLAEELKKEVKSLSFGGKVRFLGQRRDIPVVLRALDLYVLPSLWEGLGIAVIEAMASGLPVVVSSAGGLVEVVEDDRTGYVVKPGDEEMLADSISKLLLDEDRARAFGARGKIRAEEVFSAGAMVRSLTRLYLEIAGDRARPEKI